MYALLVFLGLTCSSPPLSVVTVLILLSGVPPVTAQLHAPSALQHVCRTLVHQLTLVHLEYKGRFDQHYRCPCFRVIRAGRAYALQHYDREFASLIGGKSTCISRSFAARQNLSSPYHTYCTPTHSTHFIDTRSNTTRKVPHDFSFLTCSLKGGWGWRLIVMEIRC